MTGMERNGDIVLLGAYVSGSRVVCCLNCFGGLWGRAKSMPAWALVANCARQSSRCRCWPCCCPPPSLLLRGRTHTFFVPTASLPGARTGPAVCALEQPALAHQHDRDQQPPVSGWGCVPACPLADPNASSPEQLPLARKMLSKHSQPAATPSATPQPAPGAQQHVSLAPSVPSLPSPHPLRRWFGIPSYHVQQMFRRAQGTHYLDTHVVTNPSTQVRLLCLLCCCSLLAC